MLVTPNFYLPPEGSPRKKVRLEYRYHSASQNDLNYPQLYQPNQLQLNTPSQKTKVGGRVQNFC